MTNQERIALIKEAIALIEEAQAMVDEAVADTELEDNYIAYGRYGFDTLLNNGNRYDSGLRDIVDDFASEATRCTA